MQPDTLFIEDLPTEYRGLQFTYTVRPNSGGPGFMLCADLAGTVLKTPCVPWDDVSMRTSAKNLMQKHYQRFIKTLIIESPDQEIAVKPVG